MSTRASTPSAARRAAAVEARRAALDAIRAAGRPTYPEALPITARRDELLAAIRDHQVVIVAGETGSGKSTQLPKLCLELGRGVEGLIGHTQPRRVAARTIAERVAEELGTELGVGVGYTVRFTDRVGAGTLVRVMTDGILLAELQRDRMLRRYDTIIVDEAHERSLNIDFILGYLRRLAPQRPDLKVIVTSATIDTARFARHFALDGVDAPVVEITGRTYPVEVRHRPFGADNADDPDDDRDQVQAVCDAVDELAGAGRGDVLVFLSGEREIHDTADALRRRQLAHTEILPLYARLSSAEQHRIFEAHRGRRIVLSTNVAETSLTVPGVRYVVDAGTARISRYSRRLKVQRLPIEAISRASADQRAGRCGRVAPGICIRLYSADDLAARPEFTEPEILRTNLASVILQMTALGLGDVAAFPFVEAPDTASVRDGYLLLEELAAIGPPDEHGRRRLTEIGRRLARLPIDPRLGRMVLEAERHGCVREVLVIAAALSIQDPREWPQEHREEAAAQHRRFDVAGSDLMSLVKLWDHLREEQRRLSSNQFRKLCRAEHLSYLRVREWQDLYSQLRQVAGELGVRPSTAESHPDRVHQAVLAGLLSHLGQRDRETRQYRGARGSRWSIARGSVVATALPTWVMAGELVETERIWARRVAAIQPEWAERVGARLVRRSYGEPRWDAHRGAAVTTETVTLYGLPVVSGRTVGYDRVDAAVARSMFLRHALVEGDWGSHHRFLARNRAVIERVRAMGDRVRRADVLDDDVIVEQYDEVVPAGIVSGRHFDRWWKQESSAQPARLDLSEERLATGISAGFQPSDFPDAWDQDGLVLALRYRYDPGGPLDGVSVHVPLTALGQVRDEGFDWQVPGHRKELVEALVRTLPKDLRRRLIPLADTIEAAWRGLGAPSGRLVDSLAASLGEVSGAVVDPDAFDVTRLPAHLRMTFVVHDEAGTVLDAGWDLAAIRTRLAAAAREAVSRATPIEERTGIVEWDLGAIPQQVASAAGGHTVRGYPALLDDGDSVSLRVLTNAALQQRVMWGGVRRLLVLTAAPSVRSVARDLPRGARLALAAAGTSPEALAGDCVLAAVDRVMGDHAELPWDEASFAALGREVRVRVPVIAGDALDAAVDILAAAQRVRSHLERFVAPAVRPSADDAAAHLDRLVRPGFVRVAGTRRLADVHRYVRGIEHRLERLAGEVPRDQRRLAEVVPLERRYAALLGRFGRQPVPAEVIELGWTLEELRVSLFAQPLGAKGAVSATRLARTLATVESVS